MAPMKSEAPEFSGLCRDLLLELGQSDLLSETNPGPMDRAALKQFLQQAIVAPASDRDEILQCLLQAYLRLQQYDYDRTNFLARALHDFRAPLTAISGYCGLFLDGLLGHLSSEQKDVLQRVQRSANRLSRLAVSMFELTVSHRTGNRLALRRNSLENGIAQAIHEIRPFSDEKVISITVSLRDIPDLLWFDADQLVQVLVNLLDNACRFTPRHGLIEVSAYPYFWERRSRRGQAIAFERRTRWSDEPNAIRVAVKDSGPPVPPESIPLLFDEYVSNVSPEDRSGGGLGLAICKLIVRMHQGEVWSASEPDGVTFGFNLPLHPEISAYGETQSAHLEHGELVS